MASLLSFSIPLRRKLARVFRPFLVLMLVLAFSLPLRRHRATVSNHATNIPNSFSNLDNTHPGVTIVSSNIQKPEIDRRDYLLIILENNLEVLLISDNNAEYSSAAMNVHAGYMKDPKDFPGLAHFCEHIVFLGTIKCPGANEYDQFLAVHDGRGNARTACGDTKYFFKIASGFLEPALDRFVQLFQAPLFRVNLTQTVLSAVDSEHQKNRHSDIWRFQQLKRSNSNPECPYNCFDTGNMFSLQEHPSSKGLDLHQSLREFHETYYVAPQMKLVVLGNETLAQLEDWVIEKFGTLPNKDITGPDIRYEPLTYKELQIEVRVEPVTNITLLELIFNFPDLRPHMLSKPDYILSHLFRREGRGSLLSYLKSTKHWVNSLSARTTHINAGTELFSISMDLTKEGLGNYKEIVAIVFKYIELLKQESREKFQMIWEELKFMRDVDFRFAERDELTEFTSSTAFLMQRGYPPDWVLSGHLLLREFDFDAIKQCLNFLRADGFQLYLVAKGISRGTSEEKWYGTKYDREPLPPDLLGVIEAMPIIPELLMPESNPFIPKNLQVHRNNIYTSPKHPILLRKSSTQKIWFMNEGGFGPKLDIYFLLRTPKANESPLTSMLTKLYVLLVRDQLKEISFDATVAGITYSLSADDNGLLLTMHGFNDNLHVLLIKITHEMLNLVVNQDRFDVLKDSFLRDIANEQLASPYIRAGKLTQYFVTSQYWSNDERRQAVKSITADDVQTFIPELLSKLHLETLILGSATKEYALEVSNIVQETFGAKPLDLDSIDGPRSLLIPPGTKIIMEEVLENPKDVNNGIGYFCQVTSNGDTRKSVLLRLVARIGKSSAYDFLRSQLQLGYVVMSGIRETIATEGYQILIQSCQPPTYLENKIELFLEMLREEIVNMSEDQFSSHIYSLVHELNQTHHTLTEISGRYWKHIDDGFYDFAREDKDIMRAGDITKETLLSFYDEYIHPSSLNRRVLSVHIKSQIADDTNDRQLVTSSPVNDMESMQVLREIKLDGPDVPNSRHMLELSKKPEPVQSLDTFLEAN